MGGEGRRGVEESEKGGRAGRENRARERAGRAHAIQTSLSPLLSHLHHTVAVREPAEPHIVLILRVHLERIHTELHRVEELLPRVQLPPRLAHCDRPEAPRAHDDRANPGTTAAEGGASSPPAPEGLVEEVPGRGERDGREGEGGGASAGGG